MSNASYEDWTQGRELRAVGTNAGSEPIAFQEWCHFKEAFAPELVARAIRESKIPVKSCVDPFGGSGTTALTCQFMGVEPSTIEVNPYLADLIEAKVTTYDSDNLASELGRIMADAEKCIDPEFHALSNSTPLTLVEPGVNGRWIFDADIAQRIWAILRSIERCSNKPHQRFFRVLLGGILIGVSNVVVNGKGRRYRSNWAGRKNNPTIVDNAFASAAHRAILDVHRYSK